MAKLFKWLSDGCEARRSWTLDDGTQMAGGFRLERGLTYDSAIVPPHVLAEWIKTGNAELVKTKKED